MRYYEKFSLKLKCLFNRLFHNEKFLYVFWGIIVTFFNILVATNCYRYLQINSDSLRNFVSNLIEWLVGVVLSFFTNKFLVFKDFLVKLSIIISQLFSFAITRVLEFILSSLVMFLFVNVFCINYNISKILSTIIFILFNYICIKFIVFKKKSKIEGV